MAIAVTTLNLVLGRAVAGGATLPSGYFSTFTQSISANAGSGALTMDSLLQAGQKSTNNTFSSITTGNNQDIGMAQFVSYPFSTSTSISAANWTINFALQLSNATASFVWKGKAALYLVNGTGGSAGTIKTTIFSLADVGSTARTTTAEQTCRSTTVSGSAATAAQYDYLALELGINVNNTSGGSLAPNITLYADGVTATSTDATTVSNHESLITSPSTLNLYPVVLRTQQPVSPTEQPRGPGLVRNMQFAVPPAEQVRGPGLVRAQGAVPAALTTRTADPAIYRMRGFDSNTAVNRIVYWVANKIDTTAAQYTGSSGPVSDVIVAAVIES